MKTLFFVFVTALLITGCSYKNENIVLKSYETNYSSDNLMSKRDIYLAFVKDIRADKAIGYLEQDGNKSVAFKSNTNFAKEYEKAFLNALRIAGFEHSLDAQHADVILKIYIKNISIVYTDATFGENLKGVIEIQSVITMGTKTVTQNFKEQSAKWIAPSHSSKDLEPFLQQLFDQSVNDAVARLVKLH